MSESGTNDLNEKLKKRIQQVQENSASEMNRALKGLEKRLQDTWTKELTSIESGIRSKLKWSLNLTATPLMVAWVFILLTTFTASWGMGELLKRQVQTYQENSAKIDKLKQEAEFFKSQNLTKDLAIATCEVKTKTGSKPMWCAKVIDGGDSSYYGDGYRIIAPKEQ